MLILGEYIYVILVTAMTAMTVIPEKEGKVSHVGKGVEC